VWNDGSTDDTGTVLDELAQIMDGAKDNPELPAFRCFKSERLGKSRVTTLAAQKAQGDTVWLCADDGTAAPDAAGVLAARLENDPDLVAVYAQSNAGDGAAQPMQEWPDIAEGSVLRHVLEDCFVHPGPLLARRDALLAVETAEDEVTDNAADLITRLACAGPIELVSEPLYNTQTLPNDGPYGPLPRRRAMPIAMFEAMYRSDDRALVHRAALLQRACVCARRNDWTAAMRDITDAAKLVPGVRLADVEKAICHRALLGKGGCDGLWTQSIRRELRKVARMSAGGASIARAFLRALSSTDVGISGTVGMFSTSIRTATLGQSLGEKPETLIERQILPLSAYHAIGR